MVAPAEIKKASKTKEFTNFYENLDEAMIRLRHTVVMYDDKPCAVWSLANHKDGIIRAYIREIGEEKPALSPSGTTGFPGDHPDPNQRGLMMDAWMDANPKWGIQRKMMNSPHFNKFRPFNLGMMNYQDQVVFVERMPMRHTQQGLTAAHATATRLTLSTKINLGGKDSFKLNPGDVYKEMFRDCILAQHPPAKEVIKNLHDEDIANEGVAFDRNFAFVRGPVRTLYLAYKTDIIGHLPLGDLSEVRIPRKYSHCREAVEELSLFRNVKIM